jgi:hypothetical protein
MQYPHMQYPQGSDALLTVSSLLLFVFCIVAFPQHPIISIHTLASGKYTTFVRTCQYFS